MNKIYNNLNINNLIKTDWFNQFNFLQKKEIKQGLRDNLNVSIYAKTEYKWEQMSQIRLGLKDNLDVSFYANSKFEDSQM